MAKQIDPNRLPKDFDKMVKPKLPKTNLPGPFGNVINPIEIIRINNINNVLENRSGFFIPADISIAGERRAVFYIEKTNFINNLFRTSIESASLRIIGLWIWLIRDGAESKLLISRATTAVSEMLIPEPELRYQIHSRSADGITENYVGDFNLAWKTAKINEGHFGGIKGFFVGKGALNSFILNATDTNGIQIELWQRTDNYPTLLFSKVSNSKRTISLVGMTATPRIRPIDDGDGMAGSRPCPPYNS